MSVLVMQLLDLVSVSLSLLLLMLLSNFMLVLGEPINGSCLRHPKVVLVRAHRGDVTARGVFAPSAGNRGKEERCAECRATRALRWQLWRNQGRVLCPSQSQGDMPTLEVTDVGLGEATA